MSFHLLIRLFLQSQSITLSIILVLFFKSKKITFFSLGSLYCDSHIYCPSLPSCFFNGTPAHSHLSSQLSSARTPVHSHLPACPYVCLSAILNSHTGHVFKNAKTVGRASTPVRPCRGSSVCVCVRNILPEEADRWEREDISPTTSAAKCLLLRCVASPTCALRPLISKCVDR